MARKRHTPEAILGKLRSADVLLDQGESIAEVARKLEVSEQTYHRWRNQFGGMNGEEMKRLTDLEKENAQACRNPHPPQAASHRPWDWSQLRSGYRGSPRES